MLTYLPKHKNNENPKIYYAPVNEFALEEAKTKIIEVLDEALETNIISREEYSEMNPEHKEPAKFDCNYKVHKANIENNIPPVRPIISGSGSLTENISICLDHHIKDLATNHDTYLQGTPHFLRVIDKVKKGPKLQTNAMIVTSDVGGAYLNIPHEDGSNCLHEALEERSDKIIPSSFLVKLMGLIQNYNIFEFYDGQLWKPWAYIQPHP